MDKTIIDWVEELGGLHASQAAEVILSDFGSDHERNVRMLAYALTAWAMLADEEEKPVQ